MSRGCMRSCLETRLISFTQLGEVDLAITYNLITDKSVRVREFQELPWGQRLRSDKDGIGPP